MAIGYLTYDIQALKACSLTCYSWYIVAVPHLHHTFVFRGIDRAGLKPLSARHALGLLPLVKDLRIPQPPSQPRWFLPQSLARRDSRHFFAFTNVQSLTVQNLDIRSFIPRLERHFRHFSPTLRSLTWKRRVVVLDSSPTSSRYSRTWITSRFELSSPTGLEPLIMDSFRSPHRSCKDDSRFPCSTQLKLGRTSSLLVVYGSVPYTSV